MTTRRIEKLITVGLFLALGASVAEAQGQILVENGAPLTYLANTEDPGIDPPLAWVEVGFDDAAWSAGTYGAGYETDSIGARGLIQTPVPFWTVSVYTRTTFHIDDVTHVENLFLGVDYDDGCVAWINGVEVFRSIEMPAGPPLWNTMAADHESSNAAGPDFGTLHDVSAAALGAIENGPNLLAVAVHNASTTSSDLVVVPKLIRNNPSATLIRGPYLQSGTHDSIIIRWRTDSPEKSRVLYGMTSDQLVNEVTVQGSRRNHELFLGGLDPDTTYFYAVGTNQEILSGGDEAHYFHTAPLPGVRKPIRVWVIGDSGTADGDAGAVRNAYESFTGDTRTDLWLMLGDNAYLDGTDLEYQAAVFDAYPRLLRKSVVWPTLGNHDGRSASSATESGVYYDIFTLPADGHAGGWASGTEAYYAFDFANVHFIVLNGHDVDRSSAGAMLTWLEEDVADTVQDWIIAYWHHPPYSRGSHDSDNPLGDDFELVEMRENALPILEDWGVDLVLAGHSHSYERSFLLDGHYGDSGSLVDPMKLDAGDGRIDGDGAYQKATQGPAGHEGAVYVVSGNAGLTSGGPLDHPVMVESFNVLGSVVLDLDGDRLQAVSLDDAGAVRDRFTLVKNTSAPPVADFVGSPLQGSVPLGVSFDERCSTNTASWDWDFDGDGITDSALQEPVAIYDTPGLYEVRLTASNAAGSDPSVRVDYICVTDGPPFPVTGLVLLDRDTVTWNLVLDGATYDVVKGDLAALISGAGDFAASLLSCIADEETGGLVEDSAVPDPGEGFYYLVRAVNCAGEAGTYDSVGAGQVASRDTAMPPPPQACP